jgi:hypothetical protein
VDGSEKMGNGSGVVTQGLAAFDLDVSVGLPAATLTFTELFADDQVVFSFDRLPAETRRELQACFSAQKPGSPGM